MSRIFTIKHLKYGIPILIFLFVILLSRLPIFLEHPEELSRGILLDLLVTIPLVYYLIIRNTSILKFTIVYVLIAGIVLSGLILPIDQQGLLTRIKYVLIPVLELGVLSMVAHKMIELNRTLKKTEGVDFYDKILLASKSVFPDRIGEVLATEIAVFYYLVKRKRQVADNDLEFTYYKKSGIKAVVIVFLFLIATETIVVHFLVSKWYESIAWVLSILGVYTMLQVIAILRSMDIRPIRLNYETKTLELRYGFGSQTSIPFASIEKIEKNRNAPLDNQEHATLSVFDILDSINVTIYLTEENTLHKIYGIKKKYRSLSMYIDERDIFVDKIEQVINGEDR